jgi:hypothetical protein
MMLYSGSFGGTRKKIRIHENLLGKISKSFKKSPAKKVTELLV